MSERDAPSPGRGRRHVASAPGGAGGALRPPACGSAPPAIGLVHPCDALALRGARIARAGIARPVLGRPRDGIGAAAERGQLDAGAFEIVDTPAHAPEAAARARGGATARSAP